MPILHAQPSSGGSNLSWDLTKYKHEDGTYPATLADCIYEEGIERRKFESDEMEECNLAIFLFAYLDDDDEVVFAQTFSYKVSTSEKSSFIKFLSNMRGKTPPLDGTYDWHTEMGRKVNLTIESKTSKKGTVYGAVTGVAPLGKKYLDDALDFDELPEIPSGRRSERPEQEEDKMDKPKRKSRKATKSTDEDEEDPF